MDVEPASHSCESSSPVGASPRMFFLLLAIAFLVRLLCAYPGLTQPETAFCREDSPTYLKPARALAETGAYTQSPDSTVPATLRPPGFSAVAALVFRAGGGLRALAVLLCLVSAMTLVPVYLTGRLLSDEKSGLLAAGFFALHITSIAEAPMLLSDTLFAFWMAWLLYFYLRLLQSGALQQAVCVTCCAALGAYTRPIALPWILLGCLGVCLVGSGTWAQRFRQCMILLLCTGCLLFPWMARNARIGAGWRLHTNLGNTLLFHNVALLKAGLTNTPAEAVRADLRKEVAATFAASPQKYATEDARESYKCTQALQVMRASPFSYARLHLQPAQALPGATRFLENLGITKPGRGTLDVLHRKGLLAAIHHYFDGAWGAVALLLPLLLLVLVLYAGAIYTLIRDIRGGQMLSAWLALSMGLYFFLLPGPVVDPRYQLPALPLLAILAGQAVVRLADARGRNFC